MRVFLILGIVAVLAACKSKKDLQESIAPPPSTTEENIDGKPQRPYQVKARLGKFSDSDPLKIVDVAIHENSLFIDVSYTGGCALHKFECVGSEAIMKSLPPKRSVKLIHSNGDDTCKSLVKQTIQVDITTLAADQTSGSVIVLLLEGFKGEIKYTYQ
ncbi:MAG: hypothetical protein JKY09_06495 [Crocinitomicaceae bacterium]|nr:hypothetical protein [Crocinitomicaceae bacterium]